MTALAPKRPGFTARQRRLVFTRQNGICALCPASLADGFQIDHRIMLAFNGAHRPDNWQGLCIPCHRIKCKAEAPKLAKVRRIIRKSDPATRKPSQMRSRPFPKDLRRRFDGKVERRTPRPEDQP